MQNRYPTIAQGYGVFITPDGGYIFPYEEYNDVKHILPACENLNVQACAILEQCTGSHTIEEIVTILDEKFEDIPHDLFSQVELFLDEALQKGYVSYSETPAEMEGLLEGSMNYYTPSHVLLETTTECNLKCGHCLLSAGEPLEDELTASQFISILDKLYKMGVRRVNLSGGEILIKEGWETLIDFCTDRFSFGFLTNGTSITEKIADKMRCLREVHISMYGADPETHEKISQVKGSFERALKGIKLLTERDISVGVSVLIVPFNLEQLEDMIRLAISLKCKIVRVGISCPLGRARSKQLELTESQKKRLDITINELMKKYEDQISIQWEEKPEKQRRDHGCGAGSTRWAIASNGDVYPCALFRIPIGNLIRDDPISICGSPEVKFLQELQAPSAVLCDNCQFFYVCKGCHGQAFAHSSKVDQCRWVHQFENAPEPFSRVF